MNIRQKVLISGVAATVAAAGSLSAVVVPLDFSDFNMASGSPTVWSDAGDEWISTNVIIGSPTVQADAVFTITNTTDGTSALPTSTVAFVDEAARGNNARVRVGGDPLNRVEDAQVFVTIEFFETGTNTPYTWAGTDDLVTQFSDLDSDLGFNRTDFGGRLLSDYDTRATSDDISPGSSLLVFDDTTITNYSIAHLDTPWTPEGNVTSTTASAQSPVTASYTGTAASSIFLVVGQLSGGDEGNRHIDIDMTPDFTIVPEPSSYGFLLGLGAIAAMGFRRRIR